MQTADTWCPLIRLSHLETTDLKVIRVTISRRRHSLFGHVRGRRRLPEVTQAHAALKLSVDARGGSGWPSLEKTHCNGGSRMESLPSTVLPLQFDTVGCKHDTCTCIIMYLSSMMMFLNQLKSFSSTFLCHLYLCL